MKIMYIVAIIGLVLAGCARHEPTITLINESEQGHTAYLFIDGMTLYAFPYDNDIENIHPGTYDFQISIYDPLAEISQLIGETITITDDIQCLIWHDGEPVTWQQ
jgi:hypothetical protein